MRPVHHVVSDVRLNEMLQRLRVGDDGLQEQTCGGKLVLVRRSRQEFHGASVRIGLFLHRRDLAGRLAAVTDVDLNGWTI